MNYDIYPGLFYQIISLFDSPFIECGMVGLIERKLKKTRSLRWSYVSRLNHKRKKMA